MNMIIYQIKQDNDPKHTSRCRQTVIQSKLVPSRLTIVFNNFGKNLPWMTNVPLAFFYSDGVPKLFNAIDEFFLVFGFHLPPHVFFQFMPKISIALQSGDSGSVLHQTIPSSSKALNIRGSMLWVIVLH